MKKIIFIGLILTLEVLLISCNNVNQETPAHKLNNQINNEQNQPPLNSFQKDIIDYSESYLTSKFGQKIFDDAITFSKIDLDLSGRIRIEYTIDLEKYVTVPNNIKSSNYFYENYLLGEITLDYSQNGELLNTWGVVDCVNNPNLCPPFSINNYEEALKIYNENCNKEFNEARFGIFATEEPYRFVWEFSETNSMRNGVWVDFATGINPNTGGIVWNIRSTCNEN
ncbi:MAG: hypothetical protein Q7S74_00405 [Nanoarchaeota archaeon]|nr:hypothetical protein [Nanoarchaeota archaeon]